MGDKDMIEVATLTVSKVAMLLSVIALGYILRRSGSLPDNAGKILSTLAALVFCPAYNLRNLWMTFTVQNITENMLIMGYGLLFTLASIGLAALLARFLGKPGLERRSLTYAFSIPNYGYFGYPVIEGVFGTAVLSKVLVFVIPLIIATNTYGYLLFTPNGKITWKRVFNPLCISVLLGMLLGVSGLPAPGLVDDALSILADCMSPVTMLLAGFVLGSFPLKKLLINLRGWWLSGIRLIGIPAAFLAVLWLAGLRDIWLLLPMTVVSMPLGLNLIVYPESMGMDASDNARMCCVSYILAVVFLPLIFGILTVLV